MNRTSKGRLDNLEDVEIKRDLVSTMFVLILQIFGRALQNYRCIQESTDSLFCRRCFPKERWCRKRV